MKNEKWVSRDFRSFLILKIGKITLFSPYFSERNNLSNNEIPSNINLIPLFFLGSNKGIRSVFLIVSRLLRLFCSEK